MVSFMSKIKIFHNQPLFESRGVISFKFHKFIEIK